MIAFHYGLLDHRLVSSEFKDLFLHMLVLSRLLNDSGLEVFKILHDIGVDDFNIFVVLG